MYESDLPQLVSTNSCNMHEFIHVDEV